MRHLILCLLLCIVARNGYCNEYALLIGASTIKTGAYPGRNFSPDPVKGAGRDVDKIKEVLLHAGFRGNNIKELVGDNATRENILKELLRLKSILKANDVFVFYFSGHGDTLLDRNQDELPYLFDQALVTNNKYIIDDELNAIWKSFASKVKIYHLIDACYSGEMYKIFQKQFLSNKFKQLLSLPIGFCSGFDGTQPFNMYSVTSATKSRTSPANPQGEGFMTEDIYQTYLKLERESKLKTISAAEFFETVCSLGNGFMFLKIHTADGDILKDDYVFKF